MPDETPTNSKSPGVSPKVVHDQVDRILSSDLFSNAGNLSRFLRFIVDQTLEGHGEDLKEYRIGVEVFGRGENFDPKDDTIVRVQARNLRAKLASYYESVGAGDPLVIELPKGRYSPVFRSVQPIRKDRGKRARVALYLGPVLVVALAAGTYRMSRHATSANVTPSLVVGPFGHDSSEKDGSYFARGISSDLTTALASSSALHVVLDPDRSSEDLPAALDFARRFGVQFVLTGSARAPQGQVRVVARLLRTRDGSQIWQQEFVGRANELSVVLDESARAVLRELRVSWPKDRRLSISRVESLEAYDLYQQSLRDRPRETTALLEQVIALDPQFAPAYARLALAYANPGRPEALANAKTAAARALQLDDQLAGGHLSRAVLLDHHDLDWIAAEHEYIQALNLDPSSANAYYFFSVLLTRMGRFDEALSQLRRGEEVSPLDDSLLGQEGWTLGMQRHYDQSIELLRKHLEPHPDDYSLNLYLGDIYLDKGDFERALLAFQTIEAQAQREPLVIGLEGYAHAALGHTAEAHKLLKRLESMAAEKRVPSTSFAFIYIGLGDKDAAFQWLERALINDRFMLSGLKVWPVYDSLHNDPRYWTLLTKLGLN